MNKKKNSLLLLLLSVPILFFSACVYENEEDLFGNSECGDVSNISLKNDVTPILENACYSCHGVGVETGGINLEDYGQLSIYAESGQLIGAIRHMEGFAVMPPSGDMLADCDIQRIEKWIEEGALNN